MARKRPAPEASGPLKLTESGAAALSEWLRAHGQSQTELGAYLGLSQVKAHRVLRRLGVLTPEQVGLASAYTYGDLTPAALVGAKAARQVLATEPRQRPAPRSASASLPIEPGAEVDVEELARRETPANLQRLRDLRDDPDAPKGLQARCAEILLEYGEGKPRQRQTSEKVAPPAEDIELVRKLEKLVGDARAKLEAESVANAQTGQSADPPGVVHG